MLNSKQKSIMLNIVASPFILSIPITMIIIFFLPNPSSKHKVVLVKKEVANKPNANENFHDLDNDGIDERVIAFHNAVKGEAAIKVLTNKGVNYEQWNFHGHYQNQQIYYHCSDLNNDGFLEIYNFYFRNDSVFMGCIQPYPEKKILFREKLITKIWKRDGKIDFTIASIKTTDIDNDGFEEMVFILKAGFSRQPRAVFIYDHQENSIKSSNTIGVHFSSIAFADFDKDSFPEIYCGSSSTANIHDSLDISYSDYSSWFLGYNHDLELLFKPIEIKGIPSYIYVCNYQNDMGKKFIASIYVNINQNKDSVVFYETKCKKYSRKILNVIPENQGNRSTCMVPILYKNKPYVFVGVIDDYLILINEKLELIKIKSEIGMVNFLLKGDLNKDGNDEYVFQTPTLEYLIIYDNLLQNPVLIKSNRKIQSDKPFNIGIVHNGTNIDELFVKAEEIIYYYSYENDYLFYLRYPMWVIVYLFVVMVLWFSQRLQGIQTKRKQHIEDTINSLQMKTIKSQMDPHFMFNVLNGLAHNVAKGKTNEAHDQILRFSQLLRSLMKRVDKIDISLGEEIEFISSYLELEKFRFKDDFEFSIHMAENVDKTQRLPRMLIQLLVENSIKHGLRDKEGLKKLDIEVNNVDGRTIIIVEDNGVGRKAAMKYSRDTGNGIKLINDMIRLNRKLRGKEIVVNYTDLYDEGEKAVGTRVEVVV